MNSHDNDVRATSILISHHAVATSASYARPLTVAGKQVSHIVDPRTGLPVGHVASATVVAADAATADALATTLNVLSIQDGLKLVERMPGR
jgi:thiamine biosynthesis lipoprotein